MDDLNSGYHRPIAAKAAALVESMATNHGFVDGNKRAALILADLLLTSSGYALVPVEPNEAIERSVEDMVVAVASGGLAFDAILQWFRTRIVPLHQAVERA